VTPEADFMLTVLGKAHGAWVEWNLLLPGRSNPTWPLAFANELRHEGYRVERRGQPGAEEYRLLQSPM
jgi:hypothetical protein